MGEVDLRRVSDSKEEVVLVEEELCDCECDSDSDGAGKERGGEMVPCEECEFERRPSVSCSNLECEG